MRVTIFKGAQGVVGSGSQGATGTQGTTGSGTQGTTGSQGTTGTQGTTGGGGSASIENWTTVSANTTVSASNKKYLVDTSSADVYISLNSAATINDITIKKKDSTSNGVIIQCAGANTIDGGVTAILTVQYQSLSLISDNTNWFIQ